MLYRYHTLERLCPPYLVRFRFSGKKMKTEVSCNVLHLSYIYWFKVLLSLDNSREFPQEKTLKNTTAGEIYSKDGQLFISII